MGRQTDVAWRIFRRHRSLASLTRLLEVVGGEQRGPVVAGEVAAVLGDNRFSPGDAAFLVEVEYLDEAETYLLSHANELDGDHYSRLFPLAEAIEKGGRHLSASLLYRALLDSILRRAQTKTYSHGVRYLRKLDQLAGAVVDWRIFHSHDLYMEKLRLNHGRKSSFWSRYGE